MKKTFVGVLASHDSVEKNIQLSKIFRSALEPGNEHRKEILKKFRFVITGGTYKRLFEGQRVDTRQKHDPKDYQLDAGTQKFLLEECNIVRLPGTQDGGVTILASLVSRRQLSLLWIFFSPITTHLLFPENLALMRLADQCRAKKFMNSGSVLEWLDKEAESDSKLNLRVVNDLEFDFPGTTPMKSSIVADPNTEGLFRYGPVGRNDVDFLRAKKENRLTDELRKAVIALISHDAMKNRMLDFAIDHERELKAFGRIIATGTTGSLIENAAPELKGNVYRYHSGPKGGDVEIATQILFGACHVVTFFIDPLHPHPHTEDIRVVFGACMIEDRVRMLSNEVQARDWMGRVVRGS